MSSLAFLLTSLLILSTGLIIRCPTAWGRDVLLSGEELGPNDVLKNQHCEFKMQSDCNLVLYEDGWPTWASQTANQGTNCILVMQYDGNLVVYADGNPIWASNTGGRESNSYPCVLRDDGCNVEIFGANQWNSIKNAISSV